MKLNEYSKKAFMNGTIESVNGSDTIVIRQHNKATVADINELYFNQCLPVIDISNKLGITVNIINRVKDVLLANKIKNYSLK